MGPGLTILVRAMNAHGQVVSLAYLETVLRQNTVEEDSGVQPGNARHINRTIQLPPGSLANPAAIAALPYQTIFHESIHAIEEDQGETSNILTSGDWAERNAYWMERHSSRWVPLLRQIEQLVRAGRIADARRQLATLRQEFAAGVPETNVTHPRPDATGMAMMRTAGYNFDLEAAVREIERRTGVTL